MLQSLKIISPLSRFRVGVIVPFWVAGVPDISPLILGGIDDPPISFGWNVEDKLLVDMSGIFQPLGTVVDRRDRVEIKVTGLHPGLTKLFVNATIPAGVLNIQNLATVVLSAVMEIEVINEFALVVPPNFPGRSLLMAPFSELQLQTNLDEITTTKIVYL